MTRRAHLVLLTGLLGLAACATSAVSVPSGPPPPALVPEAVDEPPRPVGGLRAVQERAEYPVAARNRRISGQVVVSAVVDPEGHVVWAGVETSVHPLLDESSVRAVLASRFVPAVLDGETVQVRTLVPLTFRLR